MPLIKNLNVDSDLCADSYRRREFALQKDFIRRYELGKDVSIRTSTMKGAAVIQALREISEEEVVIDQEALQAYADAEDWLCRKMQSLFFTVRHLGMNPRKMTKKVAAMIENASGGDIILEKGCDLIWIPVSAFYVDDERVYLFRVVGIDYQHNTHVMLTMRNTGVIGYTRECLNTVSSELAAYISKLESKAMEDEHVKASFTRLGSILRPEAYKQEMLEERAKMYGEVKNFGGWA